MDLPPLHLIAVPTYRRPEDLGRALAEVSAQLAALEVGPESILVVDNDPAETGRAIAEKHQVRYVVETEPGIAAVRNRALTEATAAQATTMTFLDDDEIPTTGWLPALLQMWQTTQATAVAGKVLTTFPAQTPEWVRASGAFIRPVRQHGQTMREAATNNLLLHVPKVNALGLKFDARFGLSGGEDSLFTRQLTERGGTIYWAENAVVREQESPDRFQRSWVLMRAFRSGNTATRVEVALSGNQISRLVARTRMIIKGGIRAIAGNAQRLLGTIAGSLPQRARGTRTAYRGYGMLAAAFGYVYYEYARRRAASCRACGSPPSPSVGDSRPRNFLPEADYSL